VRIESESGVECVFEAVIPSERVANRKSPANN
jgi:hypothetical protein